MEYYRGSKPRYWYMCLVVLSSVIQPSLCAENYNINDADFWPLDSEFNFTIDDFFTPDFFEQCTTEDTDGESLHNLDSDNDGTPKVVEAGPTENDNVNPDKRDRRLPIDTDGDYVDDSKDNDDDNDGIPDLVEQTGTRDTDNDDVIDVLDLDSDNDGIADVVEAGYADVDPIDGRIDDFVDSDPHDGLHDYIDPDKPLPDTDNDGDIDCRDHDSDDDTIPDVIEAGGEDANRDGEIDNFSDTDPIDGLNDSGPLLANDTDGDGLRDYCDPDSDDDGIPDEVEAGSDPYNPVDTDGDGLRDYCDPDSDDDGIPDEVEAGSDPSNPVDTDGDGDPDYLDHDSDDDGLNDDREGWWLCSRTDPDTNGDQINDSASVDPENPDRTYPYRSEDISRDNDVDGDGLPDAAEMHEIGTDFKIFSTDGDPYGDGQEYFHVNMPEISPADHPLVAAYPCLKVRLERTQITPIAEITSSTGGSRGSEWGVTHETSFENKEHHEGGVVVEAGYDGGFVGKVAAHYMGFHEKTSTTTDSKTESGFTNKDWSTATTTSLDEAAKLAFTLNVKNIGTAPAENIVPNFNIKLGKKEIATITSPTTITSLDIGETSPNFVVDQGMVGTKGEDIIASFEQLKTIDCGTPLDIETFHVDAKVKRWDEEKKEWVCIEEDFSTYMKEIDEKTATVMFSLEDGVYKEYKVYAGSGATLGDAINWTVGRDDSVSVQNNTDWVLGFSDMDIQERLIDLNESNRSIFELELEPEWYFILRQPRSEKPKIAWAGYNSDMTKVSASVTDERGIKSVIAHVMVEGEYQDLSMTDADDNTIYEASTTKAMERDKNATITATNFNDSSSQLNIGVLPSSVEAPFSDGWYVINVKSSGKYLEGSDKEHDYNARQCRGSLDPKQRWYLEHIGDGYYTIRNNASCLYLEVYQGKESTEANVQSGILEFDENHCPKMYQQWYFEPVEGSYYKISPRNSEKCLSIEQRGPIDGRSVILESYGNYEREKWMVVPLECYPSAIRYDQNCYVDDNYVFEGKHSSMYLSGLPMNESVVQAEALSQFSNWTLEPIGDGYFNITDFEGKCLATSDPNDTRNGVDVITCNCTGSENQMWRFEPTADGCYKIISKYSDKCLDVSDGKVQQFDYHGQDYQMWRVINRNRSGLVMLWDGKLLQGNFRSFVRNTSDLGDFNNMASSLFVAPGYAVILYDSPNYLGRSKIFIGNIGTSGSIYSHVGDDFNDDTSSLQIVKIDQLGAVRITRGKMPKREENGALKPELRPEMTYLMGDPSSENPVYLSDYSDDGKQLWKLEPVDVDTYRIVRVGCENNSTRSVLRINNHVEFGVGTYGSDIDLSWRIDAITEQNCNWTFDNSPDGGWYQIINPQLNAKLINLPTGDRRDVTVAYYPEFDGALWMLTR